MREVKGAEVHESNLIQGVRYWVVMKSEHHSITSGVYKARVYNDSNVPMLMFEHAYFVKGHSCGFSQDICWYRYFHPYDSLMRYYEIRNLTEEQTTELCKEARNMFERRLANTIDTHTQFPRDIAIHIAKYVNMD